MKLKEKVMNKDEIYNWLLININRNYLEYDFDIFFEKDLVIIEDDNKNLIVNSNVSLYFRKIYEKELPFKFGHINGNFIAYESDLESFKNLPNIVLGNLVLTNGKFNNTKEWKVSLVSGFINLCGHYCELENLFFLENTKFKRFELKIMNSVFKNDITINELDMYSNIKLLDDDLGSLHYEDLNKVIINEKELDSYLDSFNELKGLNNG